MENKQEESIYYACCPNCKHILLQGKNGSDCFIKCTQCGKRIQIIIQDDSVITKQAD